MSKWTFSEEWKVCGKRTCCTCPHGPYWSIVRRVGGKLRKKYLGIYVPEAGERVDRDLVLQRKYKWSEPFKEFLLRLALAILDLPGYVSQPAARARYRELAIVHHPDRGGDQHEFKLVATAWHLLQKAYAYRWDDKDDDDVED